MRRLTRCGYRVVDLFDDRVHRVRLGEPLDPFLEGAKVRLLLATFVEAGLLREDDWMLPGVPLASKGAAIDALRTSIEATVVARLLAVRGKFTVVDRPIVIGQAASIGAIVVEMACLCLCQETVHAALVGPSRARRKRLTSSRPFYDPSEMVVRSALHSDPEAFLDEATERLRVAREDVDRARRRIVYLKGEQAKPRTNLRLRPPRGEFVARVEPPPVSIETPAVLDAVSAVRGATDDLLRPVEPARRAARDPSRPRR